MKWYSAAIILLQLNFVISVNGQSPRSFLQTAMESYGNWKQLQSFYYANNRESLNPWQSYSYTHPEKAPSESELYVDLTKEWYQQHTTFHSPGGYVFDFVYIGKDSTRTLYDKNMARNGKQLFRQGKDVYLAGLTQAKQNFPYFILEAVLQANDSLSMNQNGKSTIISRKLKDDTIQDYWFGMDNYQLQKIERKATQKTERIFDHYQTIAGLAIPMKITVLVDGNFNTADTVMQFKPNTTIPSTAYDIPGIYVLPPASTPSPLHAEAIAKDIYLVKEVGGDRNILFVNMNNYIVVTEAPLSTDITKGIIDLIHKTIPDKPIKYVHISHFHNDHTSGIRQLVAEGATIITTPPMEAPLRALANSVLATSNDDLAKHPKEMMFELFTGKKVLQDKDHVIEFREVPNSHADGMSFVYFPKEQLIYESDLLTIPEDRTLTPAITATTEFDRYLKKNGIKWKRMVGHHSYGDIRPEMMREMVRLAAK